MAVELEPVPDRDAWESLCRRVGVVPWQQSWAYGAALARAGRPVRRLRLTDDGATLGVVQAVGRLGLGGRVGLWHALGGPLWCPGAATTGSAEALRALGRQLAGPGRRLLVTPALPPARIAASLRASGKRRVFTGYTTALLPLAASSERQLARAHPDWRRVWRRPLPPGWRLELVDPRADPLALDDALALHDAERRRRHYAAAPTWLVADAARRGGALLARAEGPGGLAAFMLFFRQGRSASYEVGWTSDAGRRVHAHQRLLPAVTARLRGEGVRVLDLGGLDVPAGIARFKLAAGGVPRTYAGTYL